MRHRIGSLGPALITFLLLGCASPLTTTAPSKPATPAVPRPEAKAITSGEVPENMSAKWLLAAVDVDLATAGTGTRRTHAMLFDDVVVYAGLESLRGVDRSSGKVAWKAKLDFKGYSACLAQAPPGERDPESILVVFGRVFCNEYALVRPDDGKVLAHGELGGLVDAKRWFYLEKTWYGVVGGDLLKLDGRNQVGMVQRDALAAHDQIVTDLGLHEDIVVAATTDKGRPFRAVEMGSRRVLWEKPVGAFFPRGSLGYDPSWQVSPDGRHLTAIRRNGTEVAVLIDPVTGARLGEVVKSRPEYQRWLTDSHVWAETPNATPFVGEDVLTLEPGKQLTRTSFRTGRQMWHTDLSRYRGIGIGDSPNYVARIGPRSADGKECLVVLSSETVVLVRVALADGAITGAWRLPQNYAASFARRSQIIEDGTGVLVSRDINFSLPLATDQENGDVYDLGWFDYGA